MPATETRVSRVSLFGRVADALTRNALGPRRFQASLAGHPGRSVQKRDGHFVFVDLTPSPPAYRIQLTGREFRSREIDVSWPGPGPEAVQVPGEDELQVVVTQVMGTRVAFAEIDFLPTIPAGAAVIAESGFTTTLTEDLEGVAVDGAELDAIGSIGTGDALRIVRSQRLLLWPGPYYPFPPETTLVGLRVVEDTLAEPPLEGVQVRITAVNGAPLTTVTVGGVALFRAELPGTPPPPVPPTVPLLLGTDAARTVTTNRRGEAVFHYPATTPLTSVTVSVTRTGYVSQNRTLTVQPTERTSDQVRLVPS